MDGWNFLERVCFPKLQWSQLLTWCYSPGHIGTIGFFNLAPPLRRRPQVRHYRSSRKLHYEIDKEGRFESIETLKVRNGFQDTKISEGDLAPGCEVPQYLDHAVARIHKALSRYGCCVGHCSYYFHIFTISLTCAAHYALRDLRGCRHNHLCNSTPAYDRAIILWGPDVLLLYIV